MGCSNSKAARQTRDPDDELVAPSGSSGKDSTTRARRLSLAVESKVAHAPGQQEYSAHAQAVITRGSNAKEGSKSRDSSRDKESPTAAESARAALHPTRSRRLSHIYTGEQMAQQMAEPDNAGPRAAWGPAPDDNSQPAAAQAQAQQQARSQAGPGAQVQVQVACMSRAGLEPGYKKTNQDNCFAFEKFITEQQALFGAMDGHGPNGHFVSGFVKKQLPMLLVSQMGGSSNSSNSSGSSVSVQDALRATFLEVDANLAASTIDCEFSGCTCAVAHLQGTTLTTAWVGDSRMVLGRQKKKGWRSGWEAIDLSTDHKPTTPEERARILDNHGRVERLVDETGQPMGPYRVWLQYAWLPGLAMSRALGDRLAHSVGVSSEPQHVQLELTPADKVIVLASDGVWEFITSKEAIELVGDCQTPEEACRVVSLLFFSRMAKVSEQHAWTQLLPAEHALDAAGASTKCARQSPVSGLVRSFARADKQHSPPCMPSPPAVRCLVLCLLVQLVDEAYSRWLEEEEGVVDDITAVVVKLQHPWAQ